MVESNNRLEVRSMTMAAEVESIPAQTLETVAAQSPDWGDAAGPDPVRCGVCVFGTDGRVHSPGQSTGSDRD